MKRRFAFAALLVVLALAARLLPGPRTIDDAFITFRYARNLLEGNGFVFNPGEYVQGTTTPLYTLLMAGLGVLTGGSQAPFPLLALWVNSLADAATCLLLWSIGRRVNSEAAGAAAGLVWAVAPFSVTFAIGGLETSLYVLLLTGLAWAYLEKHRRLSALLGVLALLTRPDAILLVGPLLLDRLVRAVWRGERLQTGELLIFFLPGLAWAAFATYYFGSPIPHSVTAKLEVYRLGPGESFIRLVQHYALPFMQNELLGNLPGIGLGLVLVPFLYAIGGRRVMQKQPRLLAYLLYPWLYLLVFSLPNPLIFRWYLTPPLPALSLFILVGAEHILSNIFSNSDKKKRQFQKQRFQGWRPLAVAVLLFLLPVGFSLSDWRLHPDHGPDRPAPGMAWIKLELLYRQAADLLAPQMSTNTLLAAGDVGVLGFYTPARILDTVGLNSPQSLKYYPVDPQAYVINYAIPARLILEQQPDWVVILEVYGRNTLLQDAQFQKEYTLWKKLPTDIYGSDGMLIFQKSTP